MSIEITDQLVAQIARLSRLALSEAEAREMKQHFEKVLGYIAELQQLDLSDVDPTLFSLEDSNVHRPDEPGASLPIDDIMRMAPASHPPYFLVPRIVADADDSGGHA